MDMNTPISPLILHAFYRILFIELIALVVISAVIWLLAKRVLFARSFFQFIPGRLITSSDSNRLTGVRKRLTISFGVIWIIDGLLQTQPEMSNQFISGIEAPLISGLPGFLPSLLSPLLYIWTLHPLTYDSIAAWIQVLIGVFMLFGPARRIGIFGLYASIAWAAVIWIVGEGFGVFGGATWLTGAPGAVLLYAVAAVLLLQPVTRWENGTVKRALTATIGVLWLICAVLQALPSAGFWQAGGLQGAELDMAGMSQPSWMAAPLYAAAQAFNQAPAVWNAIFVLILLALGVLWLVRPGLRGLSVSTIVFTFLTWWIGQDFGVIGGMGTDLNTGGPLLVLLLAAHALRGTSGSTAHATETTVRKGSVVWPVSTSIGIAIVAIIAASTFGTSIASRNSMSTIQGALTGAGMTPVNQKVPELKLTDQYGNSVSLADFRGKAVVLAFLDPVCYNECPLIAQEMQQADIILGPYADKVQMVAIVANPMFHSVKDVQRFDEEQGLTDMPNWTYLTSDNLAVLQDAWHKFYEYVDVPKLGMVDHAENMYFISPSGQEVWLGQANSEVSGSAAYSNLIAVYAEKLLGVSADLTGAHTIKPKTYDSGLSHPTGFDNIQMNTKSTGWATAFVDPYQEVLRTTDGGLHWANVTPEGITQRGGILIDPVTGSSAWALLPQYGYLSNSTLFHTTDGGAHWSRIGYPGPTPEMYGVNALSSNPDGTLWLTGLSHQDGNVYLYRSTDQAKTWSPISISMPVMKGSVVTTEPIRWISRTDGKMPVRVVQGSQQKILLYATRDGGRTWKLSTSQRLGTNASYGQAGDAAAELHGGLESGTRFVDFLDQDNLWSIRQIKDGTQILRSTDGGRTWLSLFSSSQLPKNAANTD